MFFKVSKIENQDLSFLIFQFPILMKIEWTEGTWISTWLGDRCEVHVTTIGNFFLKLDFIFYFVWPLKVVSYLLSTSNDRTNLFARNRSICVFVLCKIMFTVKLTRTKQDLEIT